jgi:quinol-cytochrome oxidoreductase complex cytochrome b subunit
MVVLVLLHMMRVFIWGAYKNPRKLTWLLGTFLVLHLVSFRRFGSASAQTAEASPAAAVLLFAGFWIWKGRRAQQ